jgi:(p)ppGpp synthase/HD superfamily hydrolase
MPTLSPRFTAALAFAAELHGEQLRKGTEIPYVSHLLGVASLVLEHGGDEDAAIAALLHEAAEDQGGVETLGRIRARFGTEVADIVDACTDTYEDPKPDWRQRKETYVAKLTGKTDAARLVSCADKLHNARAILGDLRRHGDHLWQRFNAAPAEICWYYRALSDAFERAGPASLSAELRLVVDEIERTVARRSER